MTSLEELKNSIESKNITDELKIFVVSKSDSAHFLLHQYLSEIIQLYQDVSYVDSVKLIIDAKMGALFFTDDTLYVCTIDKFELQNIPARDLKNSIIVCSSITDEAEKLYSDYIVKFIELEPWHIQDYIMSVCEGLSVKDSELMMKCCNNNIYRISNEIAKISIFDVQKQKDVFDMLVNNDFTSDISDYDIFSLVNPIMTHDFSKLYPVWKKVSTFDSDPMYLLSVLIGQYKTVIDVLLYPNSTPEICGISQKRYNAIKYYYKNYTKQQLIDVYGFLCDVDRQLKSGELSDIDMLDYIVVNTIQRGVN